MDLAAVFAPPGIVNSVEGFSSVAGEAQVSGGVASFTMGCSYPCNRRTVPVYLPGVSSTYKGTVSPGGSVRKAFL